MTTVSITKKDIQKTLSKITTAQGRIIVQTLAEGEYELKISERGYEVFTINIIVRSGHTTTENTVLTPILTDQNKGTA